jgi:putative SOS response-associated peptidase YedK
MLKWGLVPSWSNDPSRDPKPINARSDSLDKPTFRDAFRSKRCLIPADGFFEWSTIGGKKRATHFRMRDRSLFAFAGLWEFWTDGVEKLATCCIITTDANELVGTIHDRMPVVLSEAGYGPWLSTDTGLAEVKGMLRPYPADAMEATGIGPAINSPRNEGPDVLNSA